LKRFFLVLTATIFLLFNPSSTKAITVTPSYSDISVDKGEKIARKITFLNDQVGDAIFNLEIADVKFSEGGTPQFLTSREIPPDSLRWWVSLESNTFELKSGESKEINVNLVVPSDAAPGGHYGAVLINTTFKTQQNDKTAIGLNQKVASLLFINVEGQVNRFLEIEKFDTNSSINNSLPVKFTLLLKNQGNTHLQPHGVIEIYDLFANKQVGQVIINEDFSYLFPQSNKFLEESWTDPNPLGSIWRYFGRYKATLIMRAEATPEVRSEVIFWVLPGKLILGGVGIFLLLFIALGIYTRVVLRGVRKTRSHHGGGYG
jgi:hypothetical protein